MTNQGPSHVSADVALSLTEGSNFACLKFRYYVLGVLLSLPLH